MNEILSLDSQFCESTIKYEMIKFSGGEWHIKLDNYNKYQLIGKVIIVSRIRNSDDIIKILIAQDALKLVGVKQFDLFIPYCPYARQDRKCFGGESFTLKVFANLINSCNFDEVQILDAHSDVAQALINNCINLNNYNYVGSTILDIKEINSNKDLVLISPDSGANKKTNKLYEIFNTMLSSLVKCDKRRDVKTGNLSGFEVFSNDLEGKDCLIVDDICDGGGTFIGLAEELKKKNCGKLYLFITHGIFSKGFDGLCKNFEKIYTTNSFSDIDLEGSFFKQFKIYWV